MRRDRSAGRPGSRGVDLQRQVGHLHPLEEAGQQREELHILARIDIADDLRADLVKLAEAARLRPLVPEHGADVVELREGIFR